MKTDGCDRRANLTNLRSTMFNHALPTIQGIAVLIIGIVFALPTYQSGAAESPFQAGETVVLWGDGKSAIVFTDEDAPALVFLRGDDPKVVLGLVLTRKILMPSPGTKAVIIEMPSKAMLGPGGAPVYVRANVRIVEGKYSGETAFVPPYG
jgi:hypothetical protein